MATKIPAIPDPGHDPARVLKALKEIVEVREGLRGDPLDAFVSYRNLKDYVVTDEMIVTILGLSHGHGASHISAGTFGSWYSTTPGTYTFPQDLVVLGKMGIGTATVPHGGIGGALLAFEGVDSSTSGPHIQVTTSADDYPLIQGLPWSHGNIQIHFDSYYDMAGTQRSSYSGGSAMLMKQHASLVIFRGVANAGAAVPLSPEFRVSLTNGYVTLGETSGVVVVGTNDTVYGNLSLCGHGTGSTTGGMAAFYVAADYDTVVDYYRIQVYQDELWIGPHTDSDALKLTSSVFYVTLKYLQLDTWVFASNNEIANALLIRNQSADGADNQTISLCSGGGIGATRGAYVSLGGNESGLPGQILIVTGNVTNNAIYFYTSGILSASLFTSGGAILALGENDTTFGQMSLYGHGTGSSQGGRLQLYLAADYDTTIALFNVQSYEDDLLIGLDTDPDALKLDSNKDLYLTDGSLYVQNAGVSKFIFDSDLGVMAIQSAANQYRTVNYDVTISSQFADIHYMTYCNEVHNYTASASRGIIGQFLMIDCNTVSQDIYSVDVLGLTEYIYLRSGTEVNNVTAARFYIYPLTGSTSASCVAGDFQILGTTSTVGIGVYISVSASSTNWGIRCTANQNYFSGNMLIGDVTLPTSMTKGLSIGAGTAASAVLANAVLLWAADINAAAGQCGLHMMAESEAVALVVAGVQIKGTTGDPTGHEGKMCINTYDNNLRVYAEGGWRHLVTWDSVTDVYTSDGTWTKRPGAKLVLVQLIGGAGGGGSGRKGAASSGRSGGGGGACGGVTEVYRYASDCGATETVTVGQGGTGGAAQTTDSTNGNAGTDGTATTVGTIAYAGGGVGGGGGDTSIGTGGLQGRGNRPTQAGRPGGTVISSTASQPVSFYSVGSGGGGGGINNVNSVSGGGGAYAGDLTRSTLVDGGDGGAAATNGVDGDSGVADKFAGGGGGGGGGASGVGNAGSGGAGGTYGGGGGGGGASLDAVGNSGAGGVGQDGIAIVTTFF